MPPALDIKASLAMLRRERTDYINCALLSAYLFLVISALMIGKSVSTSLFIFRYGAFRLPFGIFAQTVFITCLIGLYLRLSRKTTPAGLITISLLILAGSVVILRVGLALRRPWAVPLLYIWSGTFGVIAPMQVWTLGNFIFNIRDARRYFGFIGSGGLLGFIAGGYLTNRLALHYGSQNLLSSVVVFCGLAICVVQLLWHRNRERITELSTYKTRSETAVSLKQSALHIKGSRYLLLIASLLTLASLATKIVDVQFSAIAERHITSSNQLTAFFGAVTTYLGWVAFALQMIFGRRLLDRLGIGVTILVLPVSLLISSVSALAFTALWTAVFLRLSDQVFKHSIDKSTTELLYLPIPAGIRFEVKSFIDTVILRAGDGLAALLLLLFTFVVPIINRARPGSISWLNLPIILLLIYVAFQIRKEYLNALRTGFEDRRLDPQNVSQFISEPGTLRELSRYLEGDSADEVLYALEILSLAEKREERLIPHLQGLLKHRAAPVRLRALQIFSSLDAEYFVPESNQLLNDANPEIRAEAARYIYICGRTDLLTCIQSLPDYPDYLIQGSMVLQLLLQNKSENTDIAEFFLERMLEPGGESGEGARLEAARVMGQIPLPTGWHRHLIRLFDDESPRVVNQALESAGRLGYHDFAPYLVGALKKRNTQVAARNALVQYGSPILETLRQYLRDETGDLEIRRRIPRVLSRIGGQNAVTILVHSLHQNDVRLRFRILSALNRLRAGNPAFEFDQGRILKQLHQELKYYYRHAQFLLAFQPTSKLTTGADRRKRDVLTETLLERQEKTEERIFRLLGLIYPHNDIYQAFYGLQSKLPQVRATTLEFLDNLLDPSLRRLVIPIIDGKLTLGDKVRRGRTFWKWSAVTREIAVHELIGTNDAWLCCCAIYTAGEAGLSGFSALLDRLSNSHDATVRETVNLVRERFPSLQVESSDLDDILLSGSWRFD